MIFSRIIIVLLLSFPVLDNAQVSFLKAYDFNKGGYSIVGTRSESDPNGLADTLDDFYTEDISVLNQIKNEWVFKKPGKRYACGYHYIIHVCKNGESVESFAVNLNCNEIVGDKGYFFFDIRKLRKFKNNLKKVYGNHVVLKDVNVARKKRDSLLLEKNVLLVPYKKWVEYEGAFRFLYECAPKDNVCLYESEKMLPKIRETIKKKYTNEPFEIYDVGGSQKEIFIEMGCNKSLFDKFDLYKRNLKSELDKWTLFDYELVWYYK